MSTHLSAVVACVCLFASTSAAQLAGPGLSWSGSSGNFARSFLPSCQNLPVVAVPGETVTLSVWGDSMSPFALFAAGSGSQCLVFQGIGAGLVLDFPIATVTFGVLTQQSPCLSCPPGHQDLQFVLPPGLPPGTALALQGAALASGNPSFTVAITGTV